MTPFYGPVLSAVHDDGFTDWARAAARRVWDRLREAGLASGRVTDLGCGSGVLLSHLADAGYDAAGVDRSPAMIELARERVPDAELEVGSIYDHGIRPSVAVTAVGEVLNYLPAPEDPEVLRGLLRRIHGALDRSGSFVCDVLERRPGAGADLEASSTRAGEGWRVSSDAHLAADGATLVRKIRVEVDGGKVETEVHRCRLLDVDDLLRTMRDAGFAVERLPGYGDSPLPGPRSVISARPS